MPPASWLPLNLLSSSEFWSAVFGAVVGGLFTLGAQVVANRAQRKRDRETERAAIRGILRAIQAELNVLRCNCLGPLQQRLAARQPGTLFATMSAQENYFSVFESNASLLGRIEDSELITRLVSVYGHAKGLIDIMNFNSRRFEFANSVALREGQDSSTIPLLAAELEGLAGAMENGLGVLLTTLEELLHLIEAYLSQR